MKNFVYLNVPSELKRKFVVVDTATGAEQADTAAAERYRRILQSQANFFIENGLIREIDASLEGWSHLRLEFDDLTEIGQRFAMSGSVEKWLRAMDRPNTKSPDDVSILKKGLERILDIPRDS